jgi:thiosulfate/3-mercaptopyruvate sulfurtransferase
VLPPFVTVDEVGSLDDPAPVLVDVRWSLDGSEGHHTYLDGHLPGAVFVDLDADLSGDPSPRTGRHPLPTPEAFAAALGARGIADDDRVVAYDAAGGTVAARLVWLLRAAGADAALLDGGLGAWSGPLERGEVTRPPVSRAVRPWPAQLLADADDVADAGSAGDGSVVVDAREPARYRGEVEPVDARAGHVPGAVNLPTSSLLEGGALRPVGAVRELATAAGIAADAEVIAYCGSGVTACFDLLALETVGVRGRLYAPSWSAWAADPARPVATSRSDEPADG